MKLNIIGMAFLLMSTTASAAKNSAVVTLDMDKRLIAKAEVLYVSQNSLCKEIRGGVLWPHLGQKTKRFDVYAKGNKLQVEKTLDTFCKYKLDSFTLKFGTSKYDSYNGQYVAAYITNGNGISEVDCRLKTDIDPARFDGKTKGINCSGDSVRLDDDFNAEVKVNLRLN